jgi:beta-N-acetylhexosaminidase
MKHASAGQLLLVGVRGAELEREEAKLLRRVQPGGFILFGRNIKTPAQLRKLTDELRDLSKVEPIITIDQEGGRVSRLRLIGSEPPNAQELRDKGDLTLIRHHGDITGRLLRLFGFNLDLCPVLDISFDDEADNSLRGRCYGRSASEVIRNAGAFKDALRGAGIASCGKHFPGYSAATLDAHHDLPKIERTRAELDANELAVFREFSAQIDSMMICHGWYPVFERKKKPASLSYRVVTDLLRGELSFDGLVMTDDLDMGAILNEYPFNEMLRLTFAAGNDLAMICHRVEKIGDACEVIEKLPDIDRALENVSRFKTKLMPPEAFSEIAFEKVNNEIWDLRVAVLGEDLASRRSEEDGARSPVELY